MNNPIFQTLVLMFLINNRPLHRSLGRQDIFLENVTGSSLCATTSIEFSSITFNWKGTLKERLKDIAAG